MVVAFYKGRKRIMNRLISWWFLGKYSHVELVFGYDETGLAICGTSSLMDEGVRIKHIRIDPENWDLIELDIDMVNAWEWMKENEGKKYDYLGAIGLVARILGNSSSRIFCSEAIAEMLGFTESWRFDPCTLYSVILRMSLNKTT